MSDTKFTKCRHCGVRGKTDEMPNHYCERCYLQDLRNAIVDRPKRHFPVSIGHVERRKVTKRKLTHELKRAIPAKIKKTQRKRREVSFKWIEKKGTLILVPVYS